MNKVDSCRINIKKAQWTRCLIGIDNSCKKIVCYVDEDENRKKDIQKIFENNGMKLEFL